MSKCNKSRFAILFGMVMWLLGGNLSAQPDTLWTRTYGGTRTDCGESVQQTKDGGYIIAGGTVSFGAGGVDVYLIKTDAKGDTLWTRTYGGLGGDCGRSVQQTQDGGYIIAGETYSFGAGRRDVYLIKTDTLGNTLWTKTYGGADEDWGMSVCETQDGGYIIAGFTYSFGAGKCDVYLIKTDTLGNTLWTKTYGGAKWDWGMSVCETQDGGYIIAGVTESFGAGKEDVYLIKTDAKGDTLWTRTYGGDTTDVGRSVQQTKDGGYIIAGYTYSFGAGRRNVYLIKIDANGDTLWTRTYGGTERDGSRSVQQTKDGGYIIAGYTYSFGAGRADVYLIKTDANGNTLWTRTYGGTHDDIGFSVCETKDGGYIIAGGTYSFGAGRGDVYLIKLGPDVGIEEGDGRLAIGALKLKAYPNPFTQKTAIRIRISGAPQKPAQIKIYDRAGKLVKTLESASQKEGHSIEWDGTDNNNEKVAPGIYFVRVLVDKFIATKKLIKLR